MLEAPRGVDELPNASPQDGANKDVRSAGPVVGNVDRRAAIIRIPRRDVPGPSLKGQLTLKLKIDRSGPPPRSSILADLALIEDELRFTDDDPMAGRVKFRGVLTDTGLVGIAQVSDAEDKVRAVGSWSLKKN